MNAAGLAAVDVLTRLMNDSVLASENSSETPSMRPLSAVSSMGKFRFREHWKHPTSTIRTTHRSGRHPRDSQRPRMAVPVCHRVVQPAPAHRRDTRAVLPDAHRHHPPQYPRTGAREGLSRRVVQALRAGEERGQVHRARTPSKETRSQAMKRIARRGLDSGAHGA